LTWRKNEFVSEQIKFDLARIEFDLEIARKRAKRASA